MSFVLPELLKGTGSKPPRLKVEGVNADSRAIKPGEVFFAIPGLHTHGDAFAAQARANGAKAMITDRPPAADPGMPVVVVPTYAVPTRGPPPSSTRHSPR